MQRASRCLVSIKPGVFGLHLGLIYLGEGGHVGIHVPGSVIAVPIGQGVAVVKERVHPVGDEIIAGFLDLARRAHDDGIVGNDRPLFEEGMARNNTVIADDAAIHDGRVDADQHVVADGAAVQRAVMGDRAIVADDRRRLPADVDHDEILNIAHFSNAHLMGLGANHGIGPEAAAFIHADAAVGLGARVDEGCTVEVGFVVFFSHLGQ